MAESFVPHRTAPKSRKRKLKPKLISSGTSHVNASFQKTASHVLTSPRKRDKLAENADSSAAPLDLENVSINAPVARTRQRGKKRATPLGKARMKVAPKKHQRGGCGNAPQDGGDERNAAAGLSLHNEPSTVVPRLPLGSVKNFGDDGSAPACSSCDTPGKTSSRSSIPTLNLTPRKTMRHGLKSITPRGLLGKDPSRENPLDDIKCEEISAPFNVQHLEHVTIDMEWKKGTGPLMHSALSDPAVEDANLYSDDSPFDLEHGAKLGQGAFSKVIKAVHKSTGVCVAAKVMSKADVRMSVEEMDRELQILRKCRHANICAVYGTQNTQDEFVILMEFCQHGDLCSVVRKRTLPEDLVAYVMLSTLRGLHYLTTQHVIHRDIKSSNLLITQRGEVKLADFGVSTASSTSEQTMVGTPHFMAPEVVGAVSQFVTHGVACSTSHSHSADIWSLGITAIELFDGHPPHFEKGTFYVMSNVHKLPSPTVENAEKISVRFQDFLSSCLQIDPNDRLDANTLQERVMISNAMADEKALRERFLEHVQNAGLTDEEIARARARKEAEKSGITPRSTRIANRPPRPASMAYNCEEWSISPSAVISDHAPSSSSSSLSAMAASGGMGTAAATSAIGHAKKHSTCCTTGVEQEATDVDESVTTRCDTGAQVDEEEVVYDTFVCGSFDHKAEITDALNDGGSSQGEGSSWSGEFSTAELAAMSADSSFKSVNAMLLQYFPKYDRDSIRGVLPALPLRDRPSMIKGLPGVESGNVDKLKKMFEDYARGMGRDESGDSSPKRKRWSKVGPADVCKPSALEHHGHPEHRRKRTRHHGDDGSEHRFVRNVVKALHKRLLDCALGEGGASGHQAIEFVQAEMRVMCKDAKWHILVAYDDSVHAQRGAGEPFVPSEALVLHILERAKLRLVECAGRRLSRENLVQFTRKHVDAAMSSDSFVKEVIKSQTDIANAVYGM